MLNINRKVFLLAWCLLLFHLGPAAEAGRIHPGDPIEIEVDVHIATPPLGDELDLFEENLKEAALMICDATDGRIKISKFWLNSSDYSSHKADIFVWPADTFAKALVRGGDEDWPFSLGRHMRLNIDHGPALIGHELGHLLLGLQDQYNNIQEDAQCGLGFSMDRQSYSPSVNSIMKEARSYCFDGQGQPSTPLTRCDSSQECADKNLGNRCAAIHDLASELNTDPNFIPNPGSTGFPGIRPGEVLHLDAFFGSDVSLDPTKKDIGSRRLWYLNQDDQGKAREYWIELAAWYQPSTSLYYLSAQLVALDKDGNEKLSEATFEVNGVPTSEMMLGFGAASSCTLPDKPAARELTAVNGFAPGDIQLVLPATDLKDVATDVRLDVDLSQLCDDADQNTSKKFEMIRRSDPDWNTGVMTGSFIGASASPMSGADYLQLGNCKDYEDERFSLSRQQWISGNQWKHVAAAADIAMAAYRIHHPTRQCQDISDCDRNESCVRGTCFLPLENCDLSKPWCGAHLLADGNDWDLMRYNLMYAWPRFLLYPDTLDVPELTGLPEPDPAASGCDLSDTTIESHFSGVDQVVVLADRSGSMAADWGNSSFTRYEHTIRAIRHFADRLVGSGTEALFGVFNTSQSYTESAFQTVVADSPPAAGEILTSDILADLESFPTAGSTAIGDALDSALDELARDGESPSDAIFLVTDGIQKTGQESCDVAERAIDQRVRIWFAPVNVEFPYEDFACINDTGGSMMAPRSFDDTPGTLFEMQTKNQGQQLSLAYKRSAVAHALNGFASKKVYKVTVEEGAAALTFQINPMAISANHWELEFKLLGPDGTVIRHTDSAFVEADDDQLGYGIRVPNPEPGLWKLKLMAPPKTKFKPEAQVLMARIEHRGPKCAVHLSRHLIDDADQSVKIMARAKWGATISRGATYVAHVQGPDGSWTPVTMTPDSEGGAVGVIEDFAVDGTHVAQVQCIVSDDAELAGGEDEDGNWTPTNGAVPDGFQRLELAPFKVELGIDPAF